MAKSKTKIALPFVCVPNTLPDTTGFHFASSHMGTVDEDVFFSRAAKRHPGATAALMRLVNETKREVVSEFLAKYQYRVVTDHETYELTIPGSSESVDAVPEEAVQVAIRPTDDLRNAASDLSPTLVDSGSVKCELFSVEDFSAHKLGQITGTGQFRLAGVNISATGDGESVTVTAANGTSAVAEVVAVPELGADIMARLSVALPPGKGKVTLLTRGLSTPEGELRPLVKPVTILAEETPPVPPTPTGPTVTAINDGTFHAGGGNVVTGVGMRFADAFPGNHLIIRDSEGTDMEAMISTDDTMPVTETSFALNIDEATPLTDGASYTFEFGMLDEGGQPVTVTQTARWQAG